MEWGGGVILGNLYPVAVLDKLHSVVSHSPSSRPSPPKSFSPPLSLRTTNVLYKKKGRKREEKTYSKQKQKQKQKNKIPISQ